MNAQAQQTNNVQMFASFERNIFIPLTGAPSDAETVYNRLRDSGARVALHRIEALINGKEETVRDFEVVTVTGHRVNQPVARTRTRDYDPCEPIKPIKRGTTYAVLMEMMVKGATMNEMLAVTNNATQGGVNDVISWQVRQRGYGIKFDKGTGKYHIAFPKGVTELVYQD